MDAIEAIELCRIIAQRGAPKAEVHVPHALFNAGEYQHLWLVERHKVRPLLDEIITGVFAADGLQALLDFGALDALFPEVSAMKEMGDANGSHKDVWQHSLAVVAGVPNTVEMRWSALLHDIGKTRTRRFTSTGKVTFHGHDHVGARMVDAMQSRTNLFADDVALLRTVRLLVMHHLRPASYKASWSDNAVRRLVTECGDPRFFERLMSLSRADLTTKQPAKRAKCGARADELEKRVAIVVAADNAPRLPKGTMGLVLVQSNGRRPGAWLNETRIELERLMLVGVIKPDQPMAYYANVARDIIDGASVR